MKIYQNKKGPIFSINLYIFMVRIFFGLVCSGLVILLGGYKKFGAETPKKWRREQHLGWLEQSPSQWFMPKCFLCIAKVSTGQRSRCGEQTTRNEIILTIIKMSFFLVLLHLLAIYWSPDINITPSISCILPGTYITSSSGEAEKQVMTKKRKEKPKFKIWRASFQRETVT
jgi:hypothetical protein